MAVDVEKFGRTVQLFDEISKQYPGAKPALMEMLALFEGMIAHQEDRLEMESKWFLARSRIPNPSNAIH